MTGRLVARLAPAGARSVHRAPRSGSASEIPPHKRALLVTYRRSGKPVPTPVWAAVGPDGLLYVRSERAAGKIKRLRRDSRLLLAPCTVRGKPLGAPFEASGRVLDAEKEPLAERALLARYGLGRALFELAMDIMRIDMCYLEITPGEWQTPGDLGGNTA
jgi:PPOX class probable F420-dependent enzyme